MKESILLTALAIENDPFLLSDITKAIQMTTNSSVPWDEESVVQELDFLGLVKPAEAGAEFRDEKVLWHWTEDGLKLREALAKCRDPD